VTHQLCAWLLCRLNIGCTFGEKFACYERVEGFRLKTCTKFKLVARLRPVGRKGQNSIRPTQPTQPHSTSSGPAVETIWIDGWG
jgi:hypothetical protein